MPEAAESSLKRLESGIAAAVTFSAGMFLIPP